VNWYKKSQVVQENGIENYFDIGHYNRTWDPDRTDKKKRKIALWQADILGNHFQVKEFDLFSEATHDDDFTATDEYGNDIGNATMYQGRYDPIKNIVSINMPVDPNNITRIVSSEEIPNRLIRQLERSFPEANLYAFEYGSPPTQIT